MKKKGGIKKKRVGNAGRKKRAAFKWVVVNVLGGWNHVTGEKSKESEKRGNRHSETTGKEKDDLNNWGGVGGSHTWRERKVGGRHW